MSDRPLIVNNVHESLVEEESFGIERSEPPLDDALRRLRLVTIGHRIEFYATRPGSGLPEQFDERADTS